MEFKASKSKRSKVIKLIVYGVQGVGKSTFMANAPEVVFLDYENSTPDLDVQVNLLDPLPKDWETTLAALEFLATGKHSFKSVAIDSLDWLENLCTDYVCRKARVKSIVDPKVFGYGKGHVQLFEEWRNLIIALDKVAASGMNVLCSAHSKVRTYNDPLGASFDRYTMKLTQNNQCDLSGYIQEWAQCVLFAHYDTVVAKIDDDRNVGLKGNTRVVHTERADAFDAKNRYGLPAKMPLDWHTFYEAAKNGVPERPEAIVARINQLTAGQELPASVKASLERNAGDSRKLSQLENWLKTTKQEPTETETKTEPTTETNETRNENATVA